MRLIRFLILFPFFLFPHADDMYLLKGGNVFLPNVGFVKKDILVDEGLIISIEDEIDSSVSENVINSDGKYITPGLIVFSALGLIEIGALPETIDIRSETYNAGFDPSDAFNPFSQAIRLNRSKGVTSTVNIPSASGYFAGLLSYTKINNGLKQKKQGPLGLLTSYGQSYDDSRAANLMFIEDLFSYVRNGYDSTKADQIQFFYGTDNEYRFTKRDLEAIQKVISKEMPLVVRVNKATDILKVLEMAKSENINLVLWEANEGHMVAEEISKAEVPVIMDPLNNIPGSFDSLNATYENVSRLHNAGVKLAFYYDQSSGAHNAYLATQSAGNAVALGVSYNEALASVTSNPAEIFDIKNVGVIAIGYDADLTIWDNDPLELMTQVETVFIDGSKQDLSNRYDELTERYTKEEELPNSYRSR